MRGRVPPCSPWLAPRTAAERLAACLVWVLASANGSCRVRRDVDQAEPSASVETAAAPDTERDQKQAEASVRPSSKAARPQTTPSDSVAAPPASVSNPSLPTRTADGGQASHASTDAGTHGDPATPSGLPSNCGVVAHGGVGSPPEQSSTVLAAVERALKALIEGGSPTQAVALGTAALEDSTIFNAGTGSSVRLDGAIQMDARITDSSGWSRAVIGIEQVQNPVLAALALEGTPHPLLIGEGATQFAWQHGQKRYDRATEAARARRDAVLRELGWSADAGAPSWATLDSRLRRSSSDGGAAASRHADAPGSVALLLRWSHDRFIGAVSDGGKPRSLEGCAGPLAESGAALFVGSKGAVAVSGEVRAAPREGFARAVYERMALTGSAKIAAEWGLRQVAAGEAVGISAINTSSAHSAATEPMPWVTWSNGEIRTGALSRP